MNESHISRESLKSVQSALSYLKRPPERLQSQCNIGLSLLSSILMARFLKQSFAQTCLKETDNGKLQQFNYSRSLITNQGTVERGRIHSARIMNYFLELIVCQELARQDNWPHCKELSCTTRQRNINLLCFPDGILFGSCTGTTTLSTNQNHNCHG